MSKNLKRTLACLVCVGSMLALAAPAQAAAPEPDYLLFPHLFPPQPPSGGTPPDLQDPCGLAVDFNGSIYASNYYRHSIDSYTIPPYPSTPPDPSFGYKLRISNVDLLDGPCGLDFDAFGRLYVNNYHRNVERYQPAGLGFGTPTVIDSAHPTGVAVHQGPDTVYVNDRTYVAAYDSTGAPLMNGPDPLKIGVGNLGDGYGLAVSRFTLTNGYLYVPDHSDDTVKVYNRFADIDDPAQIITGPPGGFGSLRDSAVAVDRVSGEVYVADTLGWPQYTERPEATIYVFDHTGAYKGRLKYNVIDGSPVGLAVDNSTGIKQGRVYVTSGNSVKSSFYAYPPGSATNESGPAPFSGEPASGDGEFSGPPAPVKSQGGSADPVASTSAEIAQKGTLRVAVSGKLAPKRLPRKGTAPISVSVGGEISTTDGSLPPQLQTMRVELNRNGQLDWDGLPVCPYDAIQPGSSSRALTACRSALVGEGSFTANITLSGQEPYPTKGRLLVFNGVKGGKPVLFGHIYAARPFASSFVIVFSVQKLGKGTYGTALNAPLPAAMDAWGRLTGLEMTLSRRYHAGGKSHSYISAGCPAPKGFSGVPFFPLARTSFAFDGGTKLTQVLGSSCKAKGS